MRETGEVVVQTLTEDMLDYIAVDLIDNFTTKGRIFLRDIAPTWLDAKQVWGMFMYNLGRTDEARETKNLAPVQPKRDFLKIILVRKPFDAKIRFTHIGRNQQSPVNIFNLPADHHRDQVVF